MPPFGEPEELEAFYATPGWALLLGLISAIGIAGGGLLLMAGYWSGVPVEIAGWCLFFATQWLAGRTECNAKLDNR